MTAVFLQYEIFIKHPNTAVTISGNEVFVDQQSSMNCSSCLGAHVKAE